MTIAAISSPFRATAGRSSLTDFSKARPRTAQRPAKLQLTRKGRLVFIGIPSMTLAAALLALVGLFTSPVLAGSTAPSSVDAVQVTVLQGDSLWSIAEAVAPGQDPRETIEQIQELNVIDGKTLRVGQEIFVPVHP
ncbi:transcriptional regulator of nitric oxide reductase [Neomicrococcus aestuarii]|uniref:Transcriptional regulator of nitric oxide reductase n=1 Tax=Neomicrococcus aestuarii TaxID=556325 RepID=A0A7W8WYV1_9MICC|nr:LysM peptidoglycan-binding domain-containing protein [Neomicrococcus aestuarii]MBB5511640.1 transcriptional regulator of nitric oxide reductase [Neomicrococcus aestuarii]